MSAHIYGCGCFRPNDAQQAVFYRVHYLAEAGVAERDPELVAAVKAYNDIVREVRGFLVCLPLSELDPFFMYGVSLAPRRSKRLQRLKL